MLNGKYKVLNYKKCDPSKFRTWKKLTPTMPVSGFWKTKDIEPNDSVSPCVSTIDAELRGAILGSDRLGFPIGSCKNPKMSARGLFFQICDLRVGNSGFPVWNLDTIATHQTFRQWQKLTPSMPVSGFRKTKDIEPNDSVLQWFSKKLTRSCVELSWARIVWGFPLIFAKTRKMSRGIRFFRIAIRDSEIPDFRFGIYTRLRPLKNLDNEKIDPDNARFRFWKNLFFTRSGGFATKAFSAPIPFDQFFQFFAKPNKGDLKPG